MIKSEDLNFSKIKEKKSIRQVICFISTELVEEMLLQYMI